MKNQGQCGSCWTFGTVGCLESLSLIRDDVNADFSEQQILDCATAASNY